MQHTRRLPPGNIRLWFLNPEDPSLERVSFRYDPELGDIVSIRGRSSRTTSDGHQFLWSPAVKALALLFLKTARESGENTGLSGEDGTSAASLDYAISKNTAWLSDMFGSDLEGSPYARSVLHRKNPERKRYGPVVIYVDETVLPRANIQIFLDNKPVTNPLDLSVLEKRLESRESVRKGAMPSPHILSNATARANTSTPVSHYQYFTTSLDLERELLQGLRSRMIDRKFSFVGPTAAAAWRDYCESGKHKYFNDSLDLVTERSGEVIKYLEPKVNILAFWPGTGAKELTLVRTVAAKRQVNVSFIDTSRDMLDIALSSTDGDTPPIRPIVADFLLPGVLPAIVQRTSESSADQNLFCFFGNTLGVHPQAKMLQPVRSAMRAQDYVLFGVNVVDFDSKQTKADIEQHFRNHYSADTFTRQCYASVSHCGLTPENGTIDIEVYPDLFHPTLWIVELYFRFHRAVTVRFAGEVIPFSEGERLLVAFFYQYSRTELEKLLHGQGFTVVEVLGERANSLELLCKRRELE